MSACSPITMAEVLRDRPDYAEGVTHARCGSCGGPLRGGLWDDGTPDGGDTVWCGPCAQAAEEEAARTEVHRDRLVDAIEVLEDLPSVEALTGAETLAAIRALVRAGDPDGDTRQGRRGMSRDAETRGILEMVRCRIVHGDPLFL